MENPIMIDLVGDSQNQLPDKLSNVAVLAENFDQQIAHIQAFVGENPDKKILIFTEKKDDARKFENLKFANFLPIHGDLQQG